MRFWVSFLLVENFWHEIPTKLLLSNNVKKSLKLSKTETVIVHGGCTEYIQAPDVVWSKAFKGRIQELYDECFANGKPEYTY